MIADYLDRDFVLKQLRAQSDYLGNVLAHYRDQTEQGAKLRAEMKNNSLTIAQITRIKAGFDAALKEAAKDKHSPKKGPYIPSSPIVCNFQAGMTAQALDPKANRVENKPPASEAAAPNQPGADTSARKQLKDRTAEQKASRRAARAAFVENDDPLYGLAGIKAKSMALFRGPHPFNAQPAKIARTDKPLTLYVFGDWGTGLPLAGKVTQRIFDQLQQSDDSRQRHVIHLGDVYYIGEPEEYERYVLKDNFWPVSSASQIKSIGSWSLNGNHDRYSGCYGYFDTLLMAPPFKRWHQAENGKPSSFFLIENEDWQIFGLDTAWNVPSLGSAFFGGSTFKDYGGQNGILTPSQVKWMKAERRTEKGCILMTHHQPASSRSTGKQHSNEAIAALEKAGVYRTIDAWIFGHEHAAVVFRPKAERTHRILKSAPDFCCCLGHGGVPVTAKNFELKATIADVLWQEDRLGDDAPIYQPVDEDPVRVAPFGFGKIETNVGSFVFSIFDHDGAIRYTTVVHRAQAGAVEAGADRRRSLAGGTRRAPPARRPVTSRKAAAAKKKTVARKQR